MDSDERHDTEIVQCDVCDHAMKPKNDVATGHICRTCLKDTQVGDQIAQ